jgi:membrane-associated protease RseP (regulator of RpoE activity)
MAAWLVVLLYVVAILTIVLIHESGHFLTAKLYRIKVEEFFVGFGPRLWSIRRGETEYGIKALPFGGYVRIAGMNPFQEPSKEELPRTFGAKPIWQRAIVIAAGPVTHFVMAVVFLAIFFVAIGVPSRFRPAVSEVCTLAPSATDPCPQAGGPSPAQQAGLKPGDRILSIDGQRISPTGDPSAGVDRFVSYTRSHVGRSIAITVEREGRVLTLHATPQLSTVGGKQVGRLGVIMDVAIVARERTDPLTAIGRGVIQTGVIAKAVFVRLGDVFGPAGLKRIGQLLIGEGERSNQDVVSVVGGARLAVEAAQVGAWDALFQLLVLFNVFIGILNLVPLPPLDGGHLAVLAYEKVRRRKPDVRKLVPLTALVAGFMILFALAVTYIDIVKPLPNPFR